MKKRYKILLKVFILACVSLAVTYLLSFLRIMNHDTFIFNFIFVILTSLVILFFFETKISQTAGQDEGHASKKIKDMEKTAADLLKERELLEEKVRERTAELEKANRKLKELDEMKTNFFTNISHEIRTPLTLILSPLESIMSGTYGEKIDKSSDILKVMKNNGFQLLKLINNLLDFTKIDNGKMNINKEDIDLKELVNYYVEIIKPAAVSRDLVLKYNCFEEKLAACIDKNLFELVFFNLISNAFKFTPNSGTITIILEKSGDDHFKLEISDTGVGIPREKYDFVFERFTQLSDNVQGSGFGIGLSLVKDIITLLGGTIDMKSEVEKGSSFIVTIPIGICTDGEPKKEFGNVESYIIQGLGNQNETVDCDSDIEKTKKTIFVVEDNVNMREFLAEVLQFEYNVITAGDGQTALKKLMKEGLKIDLIISDVMMPNLDGKEFFNRIKDDDRYRDIPFIFLTAKAKFEDKIEGLREGAMDYIYKPFSIEELLAKIESIIKKKDSIKEAYKQEIKKSLIDVLDHDKPSRVENKEPDFSKFNITPREEEIIKLILRGDEYKDISSTLNISINTVNNHIQNIYRKLDIQNRMELVNFFK